MNESTPWQLFPELAADEYEALKADIAERGVLVPVEYDEDGAVLDGHHRVRACTELGLKQWPRVVRAGMSDVEKRRHVRSLNLNRRHLSQAQKREQIADALRDAPERSDRHHARDLGVSHVTVATVRTELEATGQIDQLTRREGADGKTRPAERRKPTPAPSIFVQDDRQQERANTALRDLGDAAPAKTLDVKRAERIAREHAAEQRRQQPTEPVTIHGEAEFRHGDFRQALADLTDVDAIITDPPYPREFVPLFADLSKVAADILTPNGILAVMVGQSHLRDYFRLLDTHMEYRWVGSYVVQGPRNRVHKARVGTGWKPILLYQRPGAEPPFLLDDLFDSAGDDKRHHYWGQSESGMATLVERLTEPGQLVVDPFMGGGTTGIVARDLGRRFVGCDIDAAAVAAARNRAAAA
jgi:ParB-like chromosome segregation protein Spo0J